MTNWIQKILRVTKALTAGAVIFFVVTTTINIVRGKEEKTVAGCFQGDAVQIVRFNRDCQSPRTNGYFAIPTRYSPECSVIKIKSIEALSESGRSRFSAEIPFSEILSDATAVPKEKVRVSVISPDKSNSQGMYSCDGLKRADVLIKDLLSRDKKGILRQKKLISYGDMRFKIEGLALGEMRWVSYENGEYKVSFDQPHREADDREIDVYFKTDSQGNVLYSVECFPWNKQCHTMGSQLIRERYDLEDAEFSIQHADKVFDLMDNLPSFLGSLYMEDLIKKEGNMK